MLTPTFPPVGGYVFGGTFPRTVQFSYQEGEQLISNVRRLELYVMETLVGAVDGDRAVVLAAFEAEVNKLITDLNATSAEQQAAFAAAVAQILAGTIAVSDPVVTAILNDDESDARAKLATLFAGKAVETLTATGRLSQSNLDNAYASQATEDTVAIGRLSAGSLSDKFAASNLGRMEISENFATYPAGPLTVTSNGLPWEVWPTTGPNMPRIIADATFGNYLSFDAAAMDSLASIATYAGVQLDGNVTEFGMELSYEGWTVGGGVGAMAVMDRFIGESYNAGAGVPVSPAHFQTNPEGWGFDVNRAQGASVTNIGGGLHLQGNLVSNGIAKYYWHVALNKIDGTALITLPNGKTVVVSDTDIRRGGQHVFWEPFQNTGSHAKSRIRIHKVWATSQPLDTPLTVASAIDGNKAYIKEVQTGPDLTLNSTVVGVPGSDVKYVVPLGGQVWVELEGYVTLTADATVSIGVAWSNTTSFLAYRTIAEKVSDGGRFSVRFLLNSEASPGFVRSIQAVVVSNNNGNVAKLKLGTFHSLGLKIYPV